MWAAFTATQRTLESLQYIKKAGMLSAVQNRPDERQPWAQCATYTPAKWILTGFFKCPWAKHTHSRAEHALESLWYIVFDFRSINFSHTTHFSELYYSRSGQCRNEWYWLAWKTDWCWYKSTVRLMDSQNFMGKISKKGQSVTNQQRTITQLVSFPQLYRAFQQLSAHCFGFIAYRFSVLVHDRQNLSWSWEGAFMNWPALPDGKC